MSILGNLIFGAALGGSAIKCAAENASFRKNVKYLPNGVPYWMDRTGSNRLMDGTIICIRANGEVYDVKGNKIYSRSDEENIAVRNKVMNSNCKYKYATQHNIRAYWPLTTDLIANKAIARTMKTIKKDGSIEYRKWYLYDETREKFGKLADSAIKIDPTTTKKGDTGIVISEEEYNAIQNCPTVASTGLRSHAIMYSNEIKGTMC